MTFTHWIVLFLGISFGFLVALLIYLLYITRLRKKSIDQITKKFHNEMAERIQAEESKTKLEKALLQGQKLQAIGTLAGGIAHDFNNILYAVTGYVEMAREDVPRDSITFQNLGRVLDASHRGQDLVARILAFSRRQHHEISRISVQETLEGVLSLLKPAIPASVAIHVIHKVHENCFVMGNQTQLHQVIVNIINNAVDAMDEEGTVTIIISHLSANNSYLKQLPNSKKTDYCKIEISDTGHGMDQTILERIFEPFFTTKEVGKGTGLGLSTVHAIVQEHEGQILVDSQLGHGTTFTILLPAIMDNHG